MYPSPFAYAATLVPDILCLCTVFAWKLHVHYPVIASNGSSLSFMSSSDVGHISFAKNHAAM